MKRAAQRLLASGCMLLAMGAPIASARTIALQTGDAILQAEVANTPQLRARGLMHRRRLEANRGMLFVLDGAARACFWMKNTWVPLSIAFLDEKGKIDSMANMRPLDETRHCSAAPARFALEAPQGFFERHYLAPGDTIYGLSGSLKTR